MVGKCTNRDVGAPSAVPGAGPVAAMLECAIRRVIRNAGVGSLVRRGGLSFLPIDGALSGLGAGLIISSVTR
jgi:hypothetical protein